MRAIPLLQTFSDPRHFLTILTFALYLFLGLFSLGVFRGRRGGGEGRGVGSGESEGRRRRGGEGEGRRENAGRVREGESTAYTSNQRMMLFGLSLVIFPFIPASNLFITVGFVVAERVLFLPSLGICFVIGFGIHRLISSPRKLVRWFATFGLIFILVSHSAKVVWRNPDWHSKLTLYEAAVRMYPHNGDLLGNIGLNYRKRGDLKLAEEVYKYAMRVSPNASLPFMNYGIMLKEEQRLDEAEEVRGSK